MPAQNTSSVIFRQPLYEQVRHLLTAKIATGEWAKNQAIPNEYELSQELHVSIGTLRKAIDGLVDAHLLVRRQGKGTFVLDRISPEMRDIFDPIRDADGSFIQWQCVSLVRDGGAATTKEQAKLRLGNRERVVRFQRVRANRGRPMMFEQASIPENKIGDVSTLSAVDTTIVPLAYRFHIIIGHADETIDVRSPSDDARKALNITASHKVLRLRRVVYDSQNIPIEWCISECSLDDEVYHAPTLR